MQTYIPSFVAYIYIDTVFQRKFASPKKSEIFKQDEEWNDSEFGRSIHDNFFHF